MVGEIHDQAPAGKGVGRTHAEQGGGNRRAPTRHDCAAEQTSLASLTARATTSEHLVSVIEKHRDVVDSGSVSVRHDACVVVRSGISCTDYDLI